LLNVLLSESASTNSTNWRARCRYSLYVGEFEAVLLNVLGTAQVLLLDAGMMFTIPPDIGRTTWDRLSRGDLICVRWNGDETTDMPVALSVDATDGRTSIASKRITELDINETRNRRVIQPSKNVDWRLYAIGLSGIVILTLASFLAAAVRTAHS